MTNVTTVFDESIANISSNVSSYSKSSNVEQIIDASILTVIAVIGTFGNLLVIITRVNGGRVFKHGNIFILNLALADVIVTGIFIPTTIANVITNTNVLSDVMCNVMAYSLCAACLCSTNNMSSIAINRYWCIVRPHTCKAVFNRRNLCIAVVLNWIWACLLLLPTLFGWGGLWFDKNEDMCGFNHEKSTSYNIVVVMLGLALPIAIIIVCYWKIFGKVAENERKIRSMQCNHPERLEKRKQLKKQNVLAKTLLVTVLLFLLCWTPYGLMVIVKPDPSLFDKITARLVLSNSMMNFVIYGVMNPKFRREYVSLLGELFWCKPTSRKSFYNSSNTTSTHQNGTSVFSIQKQSQDA